MLSKIQHRKSNEKLHQIIRRNRDAEFELSVAEAKLDNLNSNEMELEMPDHPIDWNDNINDRNTEYVTFRSRAITNTGWLK